MSYKLTYKDDGVVRWMHRSSYYDIICEKNKLLAKGFHNIKIEDLDEAEHLAKQAIKKKPLYRKVQCVETGELFDNAKQAGISKQCCQKTIIKVLSKTPHYKTAGGFHWRYIYVS